MKSFMRKVFWLAALAAVAYGGYRYAPQGWQPTDLVGVPSSSASEAAARSLAVGCVDLNRASYQKLQRIRYVNPIRAKTILEMRMERPFRRLDDLTRVKGISAHRVEEIRRDGTACVR